MTLPLTPEILRTAYDFLTTTLPFNRWNLPDGEDVVFRVVRNPKVFADYLHSRGKHVIRVSGATVGHTETLLRTMAHEMIHLHEQQAGMATANQHTKAFWKLAARVCRYHGFDPKSF